MDLKQIESTKIGDVEADEVDADTGVAGRIGTTDEVP
jgi:hypothetical protein